MYQQANQFYSEIPHGGSGLYGNQYPYNQNTQNPFAPTKLPFLATLELPDLSKLTNNPIRHHFAWPSVPVKIPIDIPKFDGKNREDAANHITTYHLWCISNSFLDDLIKLWLFPRMLISNMVKWFIKLPSAALFDFQSLAIAFLTHFQLPIQYETGTKLLTSLRQNTATHISNHIHEWRRPKRLVKAPNLDALLANWFTKLLLPKISCDVSMSGAVTEEDVIRRAQHLDLIYSQSSTLYDIILQAPQPSNDKPRTTPRPHADGVIGSVSTTSVSQVVEQLGQLAITNKPTLMTSTTNSNDPSHSTDVNMVQTLKSSR